MELGGVLAIIGVLASLVVAAELLIRAMPPKGWRDDLGAYPPAGDVRASLSGGPIHTNRGPLAVVDRLRDRGAL